MSSSRYPRPTCMTLPQSICDQYRALQRSLESLQVSGTPDMAIACHSDLQSQFQALLATLPMPERQHLQRYNTEIFKELQLLGPDLMRLPLLKPGDKQEQLLARVTQRSDRLQEYIATLLESSS
ncbi:MAG: hypothetical protein AAGJ55_03075 [Cyanobacteria bacterium J06555_12]